MNRVMFSSESTEWATPQPVYNWLDSMFHFGVDVAASATNRKHTRFFSKTDNGLAQSWASETVWCNPPYGRGVGQWLRKGRDEAIRGRALCVFLVPARVGSDWWVQYVMGHAGGAGRLLRTTYNEDTRMLWLRREGLVTGVYVHDQRIVFEGMASDAAPFDSAVVVQAHPHRRPAPLAAVEEGWPILTRGWPG